LLDPHHLPPNGFISSITLRELFASSHLEVHPLPSGNRGSRSVHQPQDIIGFRGTHHYIHFRGLKNPTSNKAKGIDKHTTPTHPTTTRSLKHQQTKTRIIIKTKTAYLPVLSSYYKLRSQPPQSLPPLSRQSHVLIQVLIQVLV